MASLSEAARRQSEIAWPASNHVPMLQEDSKQRALVTEKRHEPASAQLAQSHSGAPTHSHYHYHDPRTTTIN
ncbi:hypothetical protein PTSG_06016 [Salpingoeca rosetta]|uniref:Uncharacterized protein n=1 Tax=Salpingoeca rosetta (strain ATCC 50818 / BSB-021) TaxID=946362 RepID=F2UDF6_SALR5|nr:uncharacterized protein PTSG_06016 [Salpingoeca rosetta]EGD74651.1 hypothetical protein PTSG_06016 [Salpingoeca rosetta]|eukprot:XP_004992908.1 hypothetical protein PTSG_06016 [Salpingoeca rosetta]